jgi:vancomycin resistance protein VanW
MRRFARRYLPRPLRLAVALARRALADRRAGHRLASRRAPADAFPHLFEGYALPMIVYPGQEAAAEAKRTNARILATALDGTVVGPGEVWSLWRFAGAPTRAKGYGEAAAIVDGELTTVVGGATCLVSTVVFNAGLLAGLDPVERTQHSVDTYGERRYFQLGRDATIEYGYLDLRFHNPFPFPLRLTVAVDTTEVRATFHAPVPRPFDVAIDVAVDRGEPGVITARTRRTTRGELLPTRTWIGYSRYRIPTAGPAGGPAPSPRGTPPLAPRGTPPLAPRGTPPLGPDIAMTFDRGTASPAR